MKKKILLISIIISLFLFVENAECQVVKNQFFANNYECKTTEKNICELHYSILMDEMQRLNIEVLDLKKANDSSEDWPSYLTIKNKSDQSKLSIMINSSIDVLGAELYISSPFGRIVLQKTVNRGDFENLNYCTWPPGNYTIELMEDEVLLQSTTVQILK